MSFAQQRDAENNGVWGQTFGSWVKTDGDGNTGKIDGNTAGFLLGADHKLDGQNVRGWLLRLQPWNTTSTAVAPPWISIITISVAAARQDAFSLRGSLGYTWHKIDAERKVDFSGYSDRLSANYDANSLLAFTEAGYRFGVRS
jgi:uncharacterized protein with beta-barrel porin domain